MRPKATIENLGKTFLKKGAGRKASHGFKVVNNTLDETMRVSAAVFVNLDGEILLARRPEGKDCAGLWEFPGGKLEAGETPENALIRELGEELAVSVSSDDISPLTFISCDETVKDKNFLMYLFKVTKWKGEIEPLEGQRVAWVPVEHLNDYSDLMPNVDVPLANYLTKNPTVLLS